MFKTPEDRLSEIQLYELVAEELEQGEQSKGLWAKALAEGEGNIEKAKGLYIKLRVEMIKDEWAYAKKVAIERQKQLEEECKEERERADRQNQAKQARNREREQERERRKRQNAHRDGRARERIRETRIAWICLCGGVVCIVALFVWLNKV